MSPCIHRFITSAQTLLQKTKRLPHETAQISDARTEVQQTGAPNWFDGLFVAAQVWRGIFPLSLGPGAFFFKNLLGRWSRVVFGAKFRQNAKNLELEGNILS
jgi:hypothetical protein